MREFEIKSSLTNRPYVIKRLKHLGAIFVDEVFQFDRIFLHKNDNNLLKLNENSLVLRIRKEEKKTEITVKVHQSSELDCLEENLEISESNIDSAVRLINLLGYKEIVQVKKERVSYILNEYNVCIDSVEELGDFIELELLVAEGEHFNLMEAKKKMKALFKDLGINSDDFVSQGYDTLIYLGKNTNDSKSS